VGGECRTKPLFVVKPIFRSSKEEKGERGSQSKGGKRASHSPEHLTPGVKGNSQALGGKKLLERGVLQKRDGYAASAKTTPVRIVAIGGVAPRPTFRFVKGTDPALSSPSQGPRPKGREPRTQAKGTPNPYDAPSPQKKVIPSQRSPSPPSSRGIVIIEREDELDFY